MTLATLINLKPKQTFWYAGKLAVIISQNYFEHVAFTDKDGAEIMYKAWVIVFFTNGQHVTLTSQYPNPKNLELPDYQI